MVQPYAQYVPHSQEWSTRAAGVKSGSTRFSVLHWPIIVFSDDEFVVKRSATRLISG